MTIFEDSQGPRDGRQIETLSTKQSLRSLCFKCVFVPKLCAIRLKKKLLPPIDRRNKMNFYAVKIPHPLGFFCPISGFILCGGDLRMSLGMALPAFYLAWGSPDAVSVSSCLNSWCSHRRERCSMGCVCGEKHWEAIVCNRPATLTPSYAEFPWSVSPHINPSQQALP